MRNTRVGMHTPVFLIAQSVVSKQAATLNVILVANCQTSVIFSFSLHCPRSIVEFTTNPLKKFPDRDTNKWCYESNN